ncbi:MAG: ABC transporter permease [Oscillospiraceae bacterium]|nr:ABC transporter permease [Oscillospiraceae bacterium]
MPQYIKYFCQTTGDLFKNFRRIGSLALFDYRQANKKMFLGGLWKLLSPFIQIGAYWLVFGIGLRSGAPIDGIPYVVWLTCGVTPWYMLSSCVGRAANSIYGKAAVLTRSNIPVCIIPVSTTLSAFMDSGWMILLMLVIFLCNGCRLSWEALNLVYYVFCGFAFMCALSLVTSVLVMLARDFQKLIQMGMRLMFFLSPIFWKPGRTLPGAFRLFDLCNPFAYVIRGFREGLLFHVSFWQSPRDGLIFWCVVACLYAIGVVFQSKLRKNLLDYM